jgi:transglutaminase-like putative cysteine protease
MPGIYKLFTAIVAIIGNISLISTGEMNPLFSIAGTGLLFGYYRAMKGRASLPKWSIGSLSLTTFIVFLIDATNSGDIFLAVAQMTLIFQTLKSFDIKEPWDPLQVFFVSLLQLLMASELTNSISFGVVFLVFLVFIVISILLGHFVKEGQSVFRPFLKPVALITILTLVLTAVFFVSVPRLKRGLWGKSFLRGIKTAGFSEKVDFGSFGKVKLDETVVMRVILSPDLNEPLYMRGMTFDHFDNVAWYDSIKDRIRVRRSEMVPGTDTPDKSREFEADIYLEPIDSDVIFTINNPYKIESAGYYMRRDSAGSFYMRQKISKRFFYRIFSNDLHYQDKTQLSSYLQFPLEASSVQRLTETVTSGAIGTEEKAIGIRDYLVNNFEYSLETGEPEDGSSVIEHFLFNSRKGYCEHFATAMTLMLRSAGIPARLVTGFSSSRKNEYGNYYIIRQSDAHSWVEAFINDRWERFDPTPALTSPARLSLMLLLDVLNLNWYRYVIGFSAYDQVRITHYLLGFRKPEFSIPAVLNFKTAMPVIALVLLFIIIRLKSKGLTFKKYSGVSAEYIKFRKKVSRSGGRIRPSSSTDEVLNEAVGTVRFNPSEAKRFIDCYRFLRFSGRTDTETMNDFYRIAGKLKKRRRAVTNQYDEES